MFHKKVSQLFLYMSVAQLRTEQDLFKEATRYLFRRNIDLRLKRKVMKAHLSPSKLLKAVWAAKIQERKGSSLPQETSHRALIDGGAMCLCSSRLESKLTFDSDACNITLSDIHYQCDECHSESKTSRTHILSKKIDSFQDISFVTSELWKFYEGQEYNIGHFIQTEGYDRHRPWEDYFWKLFGYKLVWKVFKSEIKAPNL